MNAGAPGVDYSFSRPNPIALFHAGYQFAVRYIGRGINEKYVSRAEVDALHRAGLDVVFSWEEGAADALGGAAWAQQAGPAAVAYMKALGAPFGTCVYFAVDFDVRPYQIATLRSAFATLRPILHDGGFTLGDYGGRVCIDNLHDLVDFGWQTLAWSYGVISSHAQLYQRAINQSFEGSSIDYDTAFAAKVGQWPQLAPPPQPKPQPAPQPPQEDRHMLVIIDTFNPDNNQGTGSYLVDPSTGAAGGLTPPIVEGNISRFRMTDPEFNKLLGGGQALNKTLTSATAALQQIASDLKPPAPAPAGA